MLRHYKGTDMPYIVSNETRFETLDELIAHYSKDGNWEPKHSNLIRECAELLSPGERFTLSQRQFVAFGVDEDGEWENKIRYPKVIQMTDETVDTLFAQRKLLQNKVKDMDNRIKDLIDERDALQKQLNKTEGNMHRHSNEVTKKLRESNLLSNL